MRKTVLLGLLVLATTVGLAQTRLLLYDFEARGVDTSAVRLTSQLLKDALNGTYKYIVVEPAPGTWCYNPVAAAESARVYSSPNALIGNIMALGGSNYLTYQLVDAASGSIALADKITMPATGEYPVMADRIATSLVQRQPYAGTIHPEVTTSPEVEPKFRHPRQPYTSLLLTAGYHFNMQPRQYATDSTFKFSSNLVNLNLAVTFETKQLLTLLQMGLLRGVHDESDLSFDLIGNYVFGQGDFSPFVGGGIGITRYSWTETNGGPRLYNDGMNLNAGVGLLGLRTYYFRLYAASYLNYTITSPVEKVKWGNVPGVKVLFGVTTPTLGPDATVKMHPALVGTTIGAFFLTGLLIALTS
jgi:hypothetical protein